MQLALFDDFHICLIVEHYNKKYQYIKVDSWAKFGDNGYKLNIKEEGIFLLPKYQKGIVTLQKLYQKIL